MPGWVYRRADGSWVAFLQETENLKGRLIVEPTFHDMPNVLLHKFTFMSSFFRDESGGEKRTSGM